jgi:hypothetical protein
MELILYSKPGCHLCEGLAEKLAQIAGLQVEIRDITTNPAWWEAFQYEIPVLCHKVNTGEQRLPRFSPRASVAQIEKQLHDLLPPLP